MNLIKCTKENNLYFNEITKMLDMNLASKSSNTYIEGIFNENGDYETFICFIKSCDDIVGGIKVKENKISNIDLFNDNNFFLPKVFEDMKKYIGMEIDIPTVKKQEVVETIKLKCIKNFKLNLDDINNKDLVLKENTSVQAIISNDGVKIEYKPNKYSISLPHELINKYFI